MKHLELTNKVFALLSKNNKELADQFAVSIKTEETDGAGYFVNFAFDKDNIVPLSNTNFPDIIGKDKNGKIIVGFVLFKKNGLIDYFEAYTFGNENWPDSDEDIILEFAQ